MHVCTWESMGIHVDGFPCNELLIKIGNTKSQSGYYSFDDGLPTINKILIL